MSHLHRNLQHPSLSVSSPSPKKTGSVKKPAGAIVIFSESIWKKERCEVSGSSLSMSAPRLPAAATVPPLSSKSKSGISSFLKSKAHENLSSENSSSPLLSYPVLTSMLQPAATNTTPSRGKSKSKNMPAPTPKRLKSQATNKTLDSFFKRN